MSSHHVVREKQEPALIIANGEACSFELIGQLLEWSPTVVVLDGALERVLDLGIKVDVVLGDFDSVDTQELAEKQFPIKIIHTPDQDYNDLEKAIMYLIDEQYPAANILWATGRRADHTLTNISILPKYAERISLKIIDDYSCIFPILPLPKKFVKWYKKGTSISLMPLGITEGISTQNLMYALTDEVLHLGYRNGSSNEAAEDGEVIVEYKKGTLLIMECND
jgi:thiamine pyrophosphokinase